MSLSPKQLLYSSIAVLLSIVILRELLGRRKKKLCLPPGPPGWPIVGNLFQVAFSGKEMIHYVRELRAIYGPLFTLRMGTRTLIFITSPELAHEALIEKSLEFANRPPENPTRNIFSCDKFTVNSALYGPEWRSLRRNMVSGMLGATRLREFYDTRSNALDRFIERLRAEAKAEGGAVWVLRNARFFVFSILLEMCFGLDLDEGTIVKTDQLMKKVLITLIPRMDDYLPLLSPFFFKQRKEALEVRKEQVDFVTALIERRKQVLKNPSLHPNAAPFSYLDSLLDLKVEGRTSPPNKDELVTLCSEFLNGGTDTTATAIEWGVAHIIDNPAIQERIYEEIVAVAGDRPVDEKDTEKMVYLQAFTKELLRKHPPTYFSLTHAAVEEGAKLAGYDIPLGANLEIFFPTIAEDPKVWQHSEAFEPERFLEGGETADITGVKGIKMIPFGAGRRFCPGMSVGTLHIMLVVARMVQNFQWLPHPSQPTIDFQDKLDFTVVMKRPLRALVRPRKN